MRVLIFVIFSAFALPLFGQAIQFTAGINYTSGAPSGAPSASGSRVRIDLVSGKWYQWNGSSWVEKTFGGGGGGGSVTTDATLTGDGSGTPLGIAQQSAATSQGLAWTGVTWSPSWGNPYTFVTTTSTITTDYNEVLIGTVSGNITIGLPACNSTNDSKRFKIVRNGTDNFSLTIDPNSTQTFYDGAATKIMYGKISIDCTCRFSGGTGVWFVDNL